MDANVLETLPAALRDAVEQYLAKHEHSRFLTARSYTRTTHVSHKAYLECVNLMVTLWYIDGDDLLGVMESSMIVGDMKVFMEESTWFN